MNAYRMVCMSFHSGGGSRRHYSSLTCFVYYWRTRCTNFQVNLYCSTEPLSPTLIGANLRQSGVLEFLKPNPRPLPDAGRGDFKQIFDCESIRFLNIVTINQKMRPVFVLAPPSRLGKGAGGVRFESKASDLPLKLAPISPTLPPESSSRLLTNEASMTRVQREGSQKEPPWHSATPSSPLPLDAPSLHIFRSLSWRVQGKGGQGVRGCISPGDSHA